MSNPNPNPPLSSNPKEVTNFIKEMEHGGVPGKKLKLDTKSGKIVITSSVNSNSDGVLTEIDMDEAKMFASSINSIAVLLQEELDEIIRQSQANSEAATQLSFMTIDDHDVFRLSKTGAVKGYFYQISEQTKETSILEYHATGNDQFLVLFYCRKSLRVYYIQGSLPTQINLLVPPTKDEIFSRINGIYETGILSDKKVLIIGLGSGGSPVALELVKQGVQNFILVDHDKLETSNISRHICGLSDLGRYKTKAVADILRNKNPYANIITHEINIVEESNEFRKALLRDVDLVICGTDNRESKMIINRICIENNKICIYGGAFRRAYGGQVFKVIPHKTLCYQCFISQLPALAEDYEISNIDQANRIAYSDKLVPIEPGLSTDIAPISNFISKLVILELLKNEKHTLSSLYEDLSEALYIWFNRRESNTGWDDKLIPLQDNIDDMSILRWYGIATEKNTHCSVCGTFDIQFELKPGGE